MLLDAQKAEAGVLLNYVSNALKFTPANGAIRVRALLEDRIFFPRWRIEDNGIGIAPENLERLFQDFHQLDDGLSRQFPGSGLGLALTTKRLSGRSLRKEVRVGVTSTHYISKGEYLLRARIALCGCARWNR